MRGIDLDKPITLLHTSLSFFPQMNIIYKKTIHFKREKSQCFPRLKSCINIKKCTAKLIHRAFSTYIEFLEITPLPSQLLPPQPLLPSCLHKLQRQQEQTPQWAQPLLLPQLLLPSFQAQQALTVPLC